MQDDDEDLLDEAETCRFIGGSKPIDPSTLWRGIKAGRYSKPIHISAQAVRWIRGELRRDRERMIAERDKATA
jgi:predicted DNA-binding transcriptional regulator AlpA